MKVFESVPITDISIAWILSYCPQLPGRFPVVLRPQMLYFLSSVGDWNAKDLRYCSQFISPLLFVPPRIAQRRVPEASVQLQQLDQLQSFILRPLHRAVCTATRQNYNANIRKPRSSTNRWIIRWTASILRIFDPILPRHFFFGRRHSQITDDICQAAQTKTNSCHHLSCNVSSSKLPWVGVGWYPHK